MASPAAALQRAPQRKPPLRRGVTTALRFAERPQPPETRPLFIVLVALLAIPAVITCWFWLKAAHLQPLLALERSLDAANDDPFVFFAMIDLAAILATVAVWLWRDARRRGFGTAARVGWMVAVGALGTLAVWAYLAVRPDDDEGR